MYCFVSGWCRYSLSISLDSTPESGSSPFVHQVSLFLILFVKFEQIQSKKASSLLCVSHWSVSPADVVIFFSSFHFGTLKQLRSVWCQHGFPLLTKQLNKKQVLLVQVSGEDKQAPWGGCQIISVQHLFTHFWLWCHVCVTVRENSLRGHIYPKAPGTK